MPRREWQRVEREYNDKMKSILKHLYLKHGNHEDVARELKVTTRTLRRWNEATGCEFALRVKC